MNCADVLPKCTGPVAALVAGIGHHDADRGKEGPQACRFSGRKKLVGGGRVVPAVRSRGIAGSPERLASTMARCTRTEPRIGGLWSTMSERSVAHRPQDLFPA